MFNNNKIQIAMLEISNQNKAVLEFYFSSAGEELYTLVDKDKADAFISDYDYPDAKTDIEQVLITSKKPIIILSVKQQNIASTVWLEKPLSATALTAAAEKLSDMISKKQQSADKVVPEEIAEVEDFFELLKEANELDDESESETAELSSIKTEDLLAAKTATIIATNNKISETVEESFFETSLIEEPDTSSEEELDISEEIADSVEESSSMSEDSLDLVEEINEASTSDASNLEFADVVIENQLSKRDDEVESESEVDALLESLILGEGNKAKKSVEKESAVDVETSTDDIFRANLELDEDLKEESNNQNDEVAEVLESVDEDLEADSIETIEAVDEIDTENVLIEESFTIHDDLNPSDEDVYTETLEIDYADLKSKKAKPEANDSKPSISEEMLLEVDDFILDKPDSSGVTESLDDTEETTIDESLENDLFNFELESNETEEVTNIEESEAVEPSLTLINDDKLDIETGDTTLDKDVIQTDLDSLLEEVSVAEDGLIDETSAPEIANFTTAESINIEDDFSKKEQVKTAVVDDSSSKNSSEFELQSLLNEVRKEADKNNPTKHGGGTGSNGQQSAYAKTEAEKRWTQLCGNMSAIQEQKQVAGISYNQKNHLLGALLNQIKSTKDSEQLYRMKYNDLIIVIDHVKNKIYCNIPTTTDEYAAVCFNEINPLEMKIHDLDYSEVRLYRSKIDENTDRAHSVESFIWTTSLLTSQGRLPKGTSLSKTIALKVWPNLTRLELVPHAMHMAAVFNKHPGSLLEIPEWMKIHQRYVFAFYNAALSLDMIELDSSKIKKSSFAFGKKGSAKKSSERGFFGRLLNRLKS